MFLKKNTASQTVTFGLVNATTGAGLTGATVGVRRCLDGTFAAATGTVTEDANGYYKFAPSQADTNADQVGYFFTATNAIPLCLNLRTTAADMSDGVRFGLTALPNAAAGASGGLPTGDASGRVLLQPTQAGVTIPTVTTVTNRVTANADQFGGATVTATTSVTFPAACTVATTTGAVGSVTGAVGSVTGAVGSVTGNVGGNVVGSVGSVAAGVDVTAIAGDASGPTNLNTMTADYTTGSLGCNLSGKVLGSGAGVIVGTGVRAVNDAGATIATATAVAALPTAAQVADTTLRRTMANVEASATGDALGLHSLYGLVQQAQKGDAQTTPGSLIVRKTDGTTTLGTLTLTTDATANPTVKVS